MGNLKETGFIKMKRVKTGWSKAVDGNDFDGRIGNGVFTWSPLTEAQFGEVLPLIQQLVEITKAVDGGMTSQEAWERFNEINTPEGW
jgi:hypothetical protein